MGIVVLVVVFLISLIPSLLIFRWLKRRHGDLEAYKKASNNAFLRGFVCVLPIIGVSLVFNIILNLTGLKKAEPLLYQALYAFLVLAFAEEIVKLFALKGLIKKKFLDYSFADIVAFMVIIGLAFGLSEDIPYAFGASPIVIIVRGLTMGHIGYGFIMGWFLAKQFQTGKKKYYVFAILIPWILHGLYDFSLSPELLAINDNLAVIGVSLAVTDIVLIMFMIRFFIKSRKREEYNIPILKG